MKNIIYITIVIFLSTTGCASLNFEKSKNVLFELETTSCYGKCPVFVLKIYSNGQSMLQAKENMNLKGLYKSKMTKNELSNLINLFNEKDYFNFKDSYRSQYKDLQTKYITYCNNNACKKIMAYDNIPKDLTELIRELENIIYKLEWKPVKSK